jgi:hypothetical protein
MASSILQRREQGVARKMSVNRLNIRAKIEETAHLRHNGRQRLHMGEANRDAQTLPLRQVHHFDTSGRAINLDRT